MFVKILIGNRRIMKIVLVDMLPEKIELNDSKIEQYIHSYICE